MDPVLNRHLRDLGSNADDLALALKMYSGMVIEAYETLTQVEPDILQKQITEGKSYQFPAIWKMEDEVHEPGVELAGNDEPISEERTVPVDTKERVAHNYLSTVDEMIGHWDTRAERARQAGRALARTTDALLLRRIIQGAKTAARGPVNEFPAGNQLTVAQAGASLAAAYPISITGSKQFQNNLAEIAQKMDEKDVPEEGRIAYIGPYMHRVLRQDNTLLSRDYQNVNTKLTRKLYEAEGFAIKKTNLTPCVNDATQAASWIAKVGNSSYSYSGDYSLTAAVCIGDRSAAGQVNYVNIDAFGPTWMESKRAWLIGAASFKGSKWLRPEACGVIEISG
ncbi:MAG TPA: phage capsid protein [Phycisphaerae bacterium]|nr:phage capsid protein [Phycisphaerae bacterium]